MLGDRNENSGYFGVAVLHGVQLRDGLEYFVELHLEWLNFVALHVGDDDLAEDLDRLANEIVVALFLSSGGEP